MDTNETWWIEPLSWTTLFSALRLTNSVFPLRTQGAHRADLAYTGSLIPLGRLVFRIIGYPYVRYWVARDKTDGRIRGVVGMYTMKSEPEAYWGGWLCVDPTARGQGIGIALIMHVVSDVKNRGDREWLRLYISTGPIEAKAQKIYDRMGFNIYKEEDEPGTGYKRLYRQMAMK